MREPLSSVPGLLSLARAAQSVPGGLLSLARAAAGSPGTSRSPQLSTRTLRTFCAGVPEIC